jgi:hypothetical protein
MGYPNFMTLYGTFFHVPGGGPWGENGFDDAMKKKVPDTFSSA